MAAAISTQTSMRTAPLATQTSRPLDGMSPKSPNMPVSGKMMWFKVPKSVYFGYGCTEESLADLTDCRVRRAFVMSDRNVHSNNYTSVVTDRLSEMDIDYELFLTVENTKFETVNQVVQAMQHFVPDCIIALGGGTVMDVAKISRVIYDPDNSITSLSDLYAYDHTQLLDDQEQKTGVSRLPPCDRHIKKLVCIPTTSGTGSEMTPIAWVQQDEKTDVKRPIISWRMTPDIAIVDGYYTSQIPKHVTASGGLNALVCSIESLVSRLANDYTTALSRRSADLLMKNLKSSVNNGDRESRKNCHNGASIAGMAAANAFVGITHSLSFAVQKFMKAQGREVHQGLTSAIILPSVIMFNAKYSTKAAKSYGALASYLQLVSLKDTSSMTGEDATKLKVKKLVDAIQDVVKSVGASTSLKEMSLDENLFMSSLNQLAHESMNVVGCTATNAVAVSEDDCRKLLTAAFSGNFSNL